MRNTLSQQRGFTLIELLVVILVIGILIAVAAPSFLGQQDKAKDSTTKQNLTVLYKAAKSDSIDNAAGQGLFRTGATLLTALSASEAQLAAKLSITDTPTSDQYGICASSNATTLKLVGHSESSNAYLFTASANGEHTLVRGTCSGAADDATFAAAGGAGVGSSCLGAGNANLVTTCQVEKARDAAVAYRAANGDSYAGMTADALRSLEPALPASAMTVIVWNSDTEYFVAIDTPAGDQFTVASDGASPLIYECQVASPTDFAPCYYSGTLSNWTPAT